MSRAARLSPAAAAALAGAAAIWAVPFFVATTFVGDDHVFLAFARHAPNPLVAFVRDQHGGEFYRPLPMLLWWGLGRMGGGAAAPFALLALALHAAAAGLVGALVAALGRGRGAALVAAALFALAPQNLEAAYWYAASTDLLATTFTLASLVALVRTRGVIPSAALALAAYLSKESALVLPALALVVLGAAPTPESWRRRLARVAPHAALAAAVLVVRHRVLGGWGGSGDPVAPLGGRLLQLASGLVHVGTGDVFLPEPLAWGAGLCALALLALVALRAARAGDGAAVAPFVFTLLALAPLLAAGWVVGARYFYLPAAGLAWAAGEALGRRSRAVALTACAMLLAFGGIAASRRRADIVAYEARVGAARRAVREGVSRGARVFHVAGAIKDLDLAVKEDPALASLSNELLVLGDVPASFVLMPPALAARAADLVAAPPLPPSGAYRFGDRRVVGLARRGDDPTLDEVIARFPDIRFLRLRPVPGGHVIARDVTEELKGGD
jgi:hypothetical protein